MMTRKLLRFAFLVIALATVFSLSLQQPLAAVTCGVGDHFVTCTMSCCAEGMVRTIYNRTGLGSTCALAKQACSQCLPPSCPAGEALCGFTYGACGF